MWLKHHKYTEIILPGWWFKMVEKTYRIIGVWAQRFKHQKWIGPKRIGGRGLIITGWCF